MYKQIRTSWILVFAFLIPLFLYIKTLLPTVGFWDTAEFQTVPYSFDIAHPTGYPTYILLGKIYLSIFNFGSIAWRMNLLSALYVSMGVFLLSILIKKITYNSYLAIFSAILFSTIPYLWSLAIRADPHALHFLFTSIFLLLTYIVLNDKKIKILPWLGLTAGISLGNHMLSIFLVPTLFLILLLSIKEIIKNKKLYLLLLTPLMLILGSCIYLLLPLISYLKPPLTIDYPINSVQSLKRHVLGEDFQGSMRNWLKDNFVDSFKFYFSLVKSSFPIYIWIFSIVSSIAILFKRMNLKFAAVCLLLFALNLYFSLRYQNAVIERYFITSFLIILIFVATYFGYLFKKHNNFIKIFICLYLLTSIILNVKANYTKLDASKDTYAYEWASRSLSETKSNGVIFSWWSYSTPLWYLQKVEGYRDDITIVNTGSGEWEDRGLQLLNTKDVYFIEEVNLRREDLKLDRIGNLYKLERINP